ncbi:MAG: hypothetical protein K1X75_09320 [Leptospirales bacterium]|nr:hypothetical protein [Leptospirales bacterium]
MRSRRRLTVLRYLLQLLAPPGALFLVSFDAAGSSGFDWILSLAIGLAAGGIAIVPRLLGRSSGPLRQQSRPRLLGLAIAGLSGVFWLRLLLPLHPSVGQWWALAAAPVFGAFTISRSRYSPSPVGVLALALLAISLSGCENLPMPHLSVIGAAGPFALVLTGVFVLLHTPGARTAALGGLALVAAFSSAFGDRAQALSIASMACLALYWPGMARRSALGALIMLLITIASVLLPLALAGYATFQGETPEEFASFAAAAIWIALAVAGWSHAALQGLSQPRS